MESDQVDHPEVVSEVRAAFERYEAALRANDAPTLDATFWDDERTLRYGVAEHGYGIEAIRRSRPRIAPVHPQRQLLNTRITCFGRDAASVCTEFAVPDSPLRGRQTQTWIRFGSHWRIVAAHVSLIDPDQLRDC